MDPLLLYEMFMYIVLPMGANIASTLLMDLGKESKKAIFRRITNKSEISSIYIEAFKKAGKKLLSKHADYKKFKKELKKLLTSSLELLNEHFENKGISLGQIEEIAEGKVPQELLDSFNSLLRKNKIRLTSSLCKDFLRELFKNASNIFYSLASKDDCELYKEIILRELALSGKRTEEIKENIGGLQKQVDSLLELHTNFQILSYNNFKRDEDLSFYYGRRPTWRDIASDRDIIREIFYEIFPKIIDAKKSEKCSYLPIIAAGGEGKSTLLMRIAYELFARGELIIFADASGFSLNPYNEIKNIYKKNKKAQHLFVIIDNIARLKEYYDQLLYQLSVHSNLRVTLIGASRINDWTAVEHKHTSNINYLYQKKKEPYRLVLREADEDQTKAKFAEKGKEIPDREIYVKKGNSFLAFMISIFYGKEHDFDYYIRDEAESLYYDEKKVYAYISALDRFGLGMPHSLILRIIGNNAESSFYDLQRKGILNLSEYDIFETRHELIADVIYKHFCRSSPKLIGEEDIYRKIINSGELAEQKTIVILLQRHLEKKLMKILKPDIVNKFNNTFIKSDYDKILATGWGMILKEIKEGFFAEKAFKRALELNEAFPETHNNYANLLENLNKDREAESHYQRALKLKEDYPEAHNNYAILLAKLNQNAEAEKHYKRVLELKENFPEALNNYGLLLHKLNRNKEAEEHYKRALDLKEDYPGGHNNYALLLYKLNRDIEAEEHYKRALKLKEDYPKAHTNYATLLQKLNRYREAEYHYKRALDLKEDFPEAHNNYAVLLDRLNREREAEEHYKRFLDLKEDYQKAHSNYGSLLDKLNKYIDAEKHFLKALEIKEDFPDVHVNYANLLKKLKRNREAEEHYKLAIELKEDYPEAFNNYANLLRELNREKEAEYYYTRALEIKKDFVEAWYNLATLYFSRIYFKPKYGIACLLNALRFNDKLQDKRKRIEDFLKKLAKFAIKRKKR